MARIVVGVDGSPESRRALEWAVDEARRRSATVEVVHAWHFAYVDPYPFIPVDRLTLEKAAWRVLDSAVADIDTHGLPAPLATVAVSGPAAKVLLDHAKEADLLVVGARGRGGFKGLLLGSVSHQVASHPPCPVVIVPSAG